MQIGELGQELGRTNKNLERLIKQNSGCCKTADEVTSGTDENVPEGFKSVSIVKTNSIGTATITFPDSTTYILTVQGEGVSYSGGRSPLFTITTGDGATWKWIASR